MAPNISSEWNEQHLMEITKEHVTNFKLVRAAFANEMTTDTKRPKRFAAVFAAGLSILTSAFTGISTYTLSRHIRGLQNQFENFKSDMSAMQHDIVNIHEGVVHMFDDFAEQLNHKFPQSSFSHCNFKVSKY